MCEDMIINKTQKLYPRFDPLILHDDIHDMQQLIVIQGASHQQSRGYLSNKYVPSNVNNELHVFWYTLTPGPNIKKNTIEFISLLHQEYFWPPQHYQHASCSTRHCNTHVNIINDIIINQSETINDSSLSYSLPICKLKILTSSVKPSSPLKNLIK